MNKSIIAILLFGSGIVTLALMTTYSGRLIPTDPEEDKHPAAAHSIETSRPAMAREIQAESRGQTMPEESGERPSGIAPGQRMSSTNHHRSMAAKTPPRQPPTTNESRPAWGAPPMAMGSAAVVAATTPHTGPVASADAVEVEIDIPDIAGAPPALVPASLAPPGGTDTIDPALQPEVDLLGEEFANRMESVPPGADDTQYRQAWDEAQYDNDVLFKAKFGIHAWLDHHIRAYHAANADP
jgi:hypothetical protein